MRRAFRAASHRACQAATASASNPFRTRSTRADASPPVSSAGPLAYDAVPWFWSDQGPHKLQIAGLSSPSDEAVARQSGNGLSVFRYRDGRLSAVESIDRAADHMAARRILTLGLPVTPEQAADPGFDLKALAKGV